MGTAPRSLLLPLCCAAALPLKPLPQRACCATACIGNTSKLWWWVPHADHCSNPSNKQYSSHCSRQCYQVVIQVIIITILPFWSMSNAISLNKVNHFRPYWTQTNIITARSFEIHFYLPVARLSKQAKKLDLAASYVAQLQQYAAIYAIASITVTAATKALWLKYRIKHVSSRGPYLSNRKVLINPAAPSTSKMTLRCFYPCFFVF